MNQRPVVAFVGPSLPHAEARALGAEVVRGPARQGDIWRALELRPRAIALVDGVFESQPSVWHHELLDALDEGVAVFGSASMGALRAAELQARGMIGVGQIFRWVRDGVVEDDAEVALLHAGAEHGYRPLTVAQVNVRHAAAQALPAGADRQARRAHPAAAGSPHSLPWRLRPERCRPQPRRSGSPGKRGDHLRRARQRGVPSRARPAARPHRARPRGPARARPLGRAAPPHLRNRRPTVPPLPQPDAGAGLHHRPARRRPDPRPPRPATTGPTLAPPRRSPQLDLGA